MKATIEFLLLTIAILSGASQSARAANYTFSNVVDSNAPAPIGNFNGGFESVSISHGVAAFRGYYNYTFTDADAGIFLGNGGPLTTVVKAGDPAPIGTVYSVGPPSIDGATTVFSVRYSDGVTFGQGIFAAAGGPLTAVSKVGDTAPTGSLVQFDSVEHSSGTTAFGASFSDGNVFLRGLFTNAGGLLTTIVKSGDAAPVGTFDNAGLNLGLLSLDDEVAAFAASYDQETKMGLFTGSGGPLTLIAKTGDPAPSGMFSAFGGVSISNGTVAFGAAYANGADTSRGIFMSDGGPLQTVVKSGDPAPLGTFRSAAYPALANGRLAFGGFYDDGVNFGSGIFVSDSGSTLKVIAEGDSLFGSTVSGFFSGSSPFDLDEQGNIAFTYVLADGRVGVAIAHLVPEPASLTLLTGALISLFALKRHSHTVSGNGNFAANDPGGDGCCTW